LIKKSHRGPLSLALVLSCLPLSLAWALRRDSLPDLPRVAFEQFLPAVRDQVQRAYNNAIEHPQEASVNGKLGMVLETYSQFEEAAVCYQRARLLDPASFRWVYYLGVVQAAEGKYDEAAATFRQALRLLPDYLPARLKLAECLRSSASWEESRALYEAILAKHPDSAEAHYGLGRVRAARHDLKGAVESFRQACELFPDYGPAHYALALSYRSLGQADESHKEFALYDKSKAGAPLAGDRLLDEVSSLNLSALHQVQLGKDLEQAGQLEQAAAAHEKALLIDPQLVQAHINLISLYGRLGQLGKAEEHYRAAVQLNPNSAESYYDYGVLLFSQRKYEQGEEAFRKALEINPLYPEAHNNLGYLLEQQGKLSEAMEHFREAIKNKPDYRLARFHLARILVNQQNYQEAIQHLLKTLTPEDESTPGYLYALGATYARAGDPQQALLYLRSARDQASRRGQSQLLASIEQDLRTLEGREVPR
jgi:tetratricopeptide (TPR) repeat protein